MMSFDYLNSRGLFITGQELIEPQQIDEYIRNGARLHIVGTNWPMELISDINAGRSHLQNNGFFTDPILVGPPTILRCLDEPIANTETTYRQFLLQNRLLGAIYEIPEQENVMLVTSIDNLSSVHRAAFPTIEIKSKISNESKEKAWKLLEEYIVSHYGR